MKKKSFRLSGQLFLKKKNKTMMKHDLSSPTRNVGKESSDQHHPVNCD
jgi:hypothetical protein